MSEIIVIQDDAPEAPVSPEHEAQMATLEAAVEEAQATAEVALAATLVEEPHVCRCGEIEARVIALETAAVIEDEEEAEMDAALAVAIEAAAEPVEEAVMPEPPVKETPPAEAEAEEKPSKAKRGGVSKGWFGSRAR